MALYAATYKKHSLPVYLYILFYELLESKIIDGILANKLTEYYDMKLQTSATDFSQQA